MYNNIVIRKSADYAILGKSRKGENMLNKNIAKFFVAAALAASLSGCVNSNDNNAASGSDGGNFTNITTPSTTTSDIPSVPSSTSDNASAKFGGKSAASAYHSY